MPSGVTITARTAGRTRAKWWSGQGLRCARGTGQNTHYRTLGAQYVGSAPWGGFQVPIVYLWRDVHIWGSPYSMLYGYDMSGGAGKGDRPRPVDRERYGRHWDRIFGRKRRLKRCR